MRTPSPDLLSDPAESNRRRTILASAGWAEFRSLTDELRALGHDVPDPDPCDGGLGARLLLVLERPGRAVASCSFVSRDNATPTARNLRRFLGEAGIERAETLIWNVVPWLDPGAVRDRAPSRADIETGLRALQELAGRMQALDVVVLAGRTARAAFATMRSARPRAAILTMPHPSPTIVCTSPSVAASIMTCLRSAASILQIPPSPQATGRQDRMPARYWTTLREGVP